MIAFIKKTALLLFVAVASTDIFAQGSSTDIDNFYNSFLPDFQKMTPEASALGQFGAYDVSGFTGVPNIYIPLFTLDSGNFSMPIGLSYDASGIKVEQDATYVGLGWNLVMGGSINHIVCGGNDFSTMSLTRPEIPNVNLYDSVFYFANTSIAPTYPMASYQYIEREQPQLAVGGGITDVIPEHRYRYEILRNVYSGYYVPDIFQASFCGHSLSFIIDTESWSVKILNEDERKYNVELSNFTNNLPKVITITDDHGMQYVFTAHNEYSEDNDHMVTDDSSYLLTSVKNANETLITFTYSTKYVYQLKSTYCETFGATDDNYFSNTTSQRVKDLFLKRKQPLDLLYYSISKYYPDTIETKREMVTFEYADRVDIAHAESMTKIRIWSKATGALIHSADLSYGNFNEEAADESLNKKYKIYNSIYTNKRLKLIEVSIDGKKHSFEYNEQDFLPSRLSLRQDFWGYYNGRDNSNDFCASPRFQFIDGALRFIESVGTANRYASTSKGKLGTLKKITYPTGGYTTFDYEVHHFDDVRGKYYYPPENSTISSMTQTTQPGTILMNLMLVNPHHKKDSADFVISVPTTVTIKNTEYDPLESSQTDIVIFSTNPNSTFQNHSYTWNINSSNNTCRDLTIDLPAGNYRIIGEFRVDSNRQSGTAVKVLLPPTVQDYQNYVSQYQDVSGKSIGGGLRVRSIGNYDSDGVLLGKTEYEYEGGILQVPTARMEKIYLQDTFTQNGSNSYGDIYSCILFNSSNPAFPTICSIGKPNVGYSKVTKKHYGKNNMLLSYDVEKYKNAGYGEWEDMNMFHVNMNGLNGKLEESTTYSTDSIKIRQIRYGYTSYGTSPQKEDIVFFPWCRPTTINEAFYAHQKYKYSLYPKYPVSVIPSYVIEKNYVNGEPMDSVLTYTSYKESNFQPASVTMSTTTGNTMTLYSYPGDSDVNNSNTVSLTNTHCISEVVMAKEYKNDALVSGYRNTYTSLSSGLPVISKNYSIRPNNTEVLELDAMGYDAYGNIREYKKKDGTPVTIIWSYNHQHPVLEVAGSTYAELTANTEIRTKLAELESKTDISVQYMRDLHRRLLTLFTTGKLFSAYLYSPWHTLSYTIAPNGYETKYEYDTAGRLKKASEFSEGSQSYNILKKFDYNYIHQQQ